MVNGDEVNGSGEFNSEDDSDSDDELDLGEEDIPVTGFAVASMKRNAEFHEMFPSVTDGDYLIDGMWRIYPTFWPSSSLS